MTLDHFLGLVVVASFALVVGTTISLATAPRRRRRRSTLTTPGDYYGMCQGNGSSMTAIELACAESLRRSRARRTSPAGWDGDAVDPASPFGRVLTGEAPKWWHNA